MPVNSVPESKKGIEKPRSLSLNRNNAILSNTKRKSEELKEISSPLKLSISNNKENKPLKRPLNGTYTNTLSAAKRLKPLTVTSTLSDKILESELVIADLPAGTAMLNGHHPPDSQYAGSAQRKTPIATLSNLGNTCFLNSVLYTLSRPTETSRQGKGTRHKLHTSRFLVAWDKSTRRIQAAARRQALPNFKGQGLLYAPRFLHNLHHLVSDLASVEQKLGSIRQKSSSLGRSAAGLASSGARSWSSKDLLSLGQSDNNAGKSKIQIATEKLHETYFNLRAAESKCLNSSSNDASPEPYAADAFLAALRDVNSTFEGNRQQDAHELLVCVLDNIRETCRALAARAPRQLLENGDSNGISRQPSLDGDGGKLGLRKSWKKKRDAKPEPESEVLPRPGWDFVADDFEGTMVVRTMCLECETVTEKAEALCELCVPVGDEDTIDDEPFRAACLSSEYLRDQNKYWCERCLRYNEARRSVAYSRLPRLLVLQLKRFSGGMEKITKHVPTPLRMPCFCELCVKRPPELQPAHRYILWAVIMHLGQSLTGGHYVSYCRDCSLDGKCEREGSGDTPANSSSSFMRTLFNRPRPQTGCAAKECCVPRAPAEARWLACDDELVKPLTNEEFEDLLSEEPKMRSAATPYLLFYVKSEVG